MTLLIDLAGGPASFVLAQTGTPAATPAVAPAPAAAAPVATGSSVMPAPAPLPADAPQPNPLSSMIPFLMIIGVFLLVFAPQIKRNKAHQKLITGLQSGDEVITSSGIFGTITQVKPDRFVIEISKGVRIEINRNNVEALAPGAAKTDDDSKKA